MMQAILITVLMFSCVSCDLYLKRIEESDVETCGRFDICNIVHKPHWGINSVEKLCRCPEGSFCPATFSNDDKQSLPVNPRTQMKFCTPIDQLYADLQPCEPGEIAIHVSKLYNVTQLDKVLNASSTLQCSCENINPIYWKYNSRYGKSLNENGTLFNIVDNFECTELKKCSANEFCGFSRSDYGFLFQRCTCDTVHDCHYYPESSEAEENVESELFYAGLMYKSHCVKNETFEHW